MDDTTIPEVNDPRIVYGVLPVSKNRVFFFSQPTRCRAQLSRRRERRELRKFYTFPPRCRRRRLRYT